MFLCHNGNVRRLCSSLCLLRQDFRIKHSCIKTKNNPSPVDSTEKTVRSSIVLRGGIGEEPAGSRKTWAFVSARGYSELELCYFATPAKDTHSGQLACLTGEGNCFSLTSHSWHEIASVINTQDLVLIKIRVTFIIISN